MRKAIDWESVERDFRAGIKSLRTMATEYGCAESAIRKKAKEKGWSRDLSAKIKQRADELVRKDEVRAKVRTDDEISERQQIEASSEVIAGAVIGQRRDIQRAIVVANQLWDQIEAEGNCPVEFRQIGDMLRKPNEYGEDKLNDLYMAAISLPQRVKSVKLLADALKVLVELQRKVLRIDEPAPPEDPLKKSTDEEIESRLAVLLGKVGAADAH